jgi:beta-N-acetylhexosaminidase
MDSRALARYGHHFALGLQASPVLTEHDKRLLEAIHPAGIILFKANFRHDLAYDDWLAEYARLLEDVRAHIGRERFLVGIDHEGGRVVRPPSPITVYDFACNWVDEAAAVGRAMGIELASLGVNVNFAPVVDVDTNPTNPVIAERAFSSDPQVVARAASAFLDAMQAEGVFGCPKHFPGHGDTDANSHFALPRVDETLEELHARELVPYQAVLARVPLVMSAHVIYERIDPDHPGTISSRILTGILREELGFAGAVISDDLGMQAIAPCFDDPFAAPRAIVAGCDILAVCAHWTDTTRTLELARAVADAASADGRVAEALEVARVRIEKVLDAAREPSVVRLPDAVFEGHRRLAPLYTPGTGRRAYTGIVAG